MRRIPKEKALEKIGERRQAGNRVDNRLLKEVKKSEALFLLTLEDEESFLSLIWQEIDDTRLLITPGKPRTLLDVTQRMKDRGSTFKKLASNMGLPKSQHNPCWFEKCVDIDAKFDFDHFYWVAVAPVNDSEREQSPRGSFYIYDGVHKTLVLSKRLLCNEEPFRQVKTLLLLPRPE